MNAEQIARKVAGSLAEVTAILQKHDCRQICFMDEYLHGYAAGLAEALRIIQEADE